VRIFLIVAVSAIMPSLYLVPIVELLLFCDAGRWAR
jgi:hypothetical protein